VHLSKELRGDEAQGKISTFLRKGNPPGRQERNAAGMDAKSERKIAAVQEQMFGQN
jgi:hypothetical protein